MKQRREREDHKSTVCELSDEILESEAWIKGGEEKGCFETEEVGERIAIGRLYKAKWVLPIQAMKCCWKNCRFDGYLWT